MRKRFARSFGLSNSAVSSTVLFISVTDTTSCAEFSNFFTRRTLYGWSVWLSWTLPLKSSALASKLLARARPLLMQLCSLVYGLDACSRAAALVSRKIHEVPGRSLVMFCEAYTVAKSESGLESELERPFFATAVIQKWLAVSRLCCLLSELNQIRRQVGCWVSPLLHFRSFFATVVYSLMKSTELPVSFRKSFDKRVERERR